MTDSVCFVCAQPAKLRCSACAPKFQVSFCTKEHQKLAWPAHKLACGERAVPFQLPPFSEYEADRAMMACQLPVSGREQQTSQDLLLQALWPAQGMQQLDARLQRLIGTNCKLVLNSPRKRDVVELVRANSASFWKATSMIPGRKPHTHPRENFMLFHTAAAGLSPVPAPSGPADDEFDLEYYHRVLVYATLVQQANTDHERSAPFAAYSTDELHEFVRASKLHIVDWIAAAATTPHQKAVSRNVVDYISYVPPQETCTHPYHHQHRHNHPH